MRGAREIRESLKLTLREVEGKTGIDRTVLSKFELGQSRLIIDNLVRLAAVYGCTIDALVTEVEPAGTAGE